MTASIIARDPDTDELGVAVFSAYPSVGMRVPFAEPGVGVVATQGFADRSFGPRGLQMLREGADAATVVDSLIATDHAPAGRQVAILAAGGDMAGFTGEGCVPCVGDVTGQQWRCQANMMAAEGVPEAMGAAFAAAEGDLAVRLLAALRSGQAAGGDARGRMSAALLVVPACGAPWESSLDLRVDHHADPLPELARALDFHRAFALMDLAAERARAGDQDGASRAGLEALSLAADDAQVLMWVGLGAAEGNLELGVTLVQRALELQPSLAGFLDRLPDNVTPAAPGVRAKLAELGLEE